MRTPFADRIRDVKFGVGWRGYNFAEVDRFVDEVADVVDALRSELQATARMPETDDGRLQQLLGIVEDLQSQLAPGLSQWQRRAQMTALVQARVRQQMERSGAVQTPPHVPMGELQRTLGEKHLAAEAAVDGIRARSAAAPEADNPQLENDGDIEAGEPDPLLSSDSVAADESPAEKSEGEKSEGDKSDADKSEAETPSSEVSDAEVSDPEAADSEEVSDPESELEISVEAVEPPKKVWEPTVSNF